MKTRALRILYHIFEALADDDRRSGFERFVARQHADHLAVQADHAYARDPDLEVLSVALV